MSNKACIFVSPHPDDIEISCAITVQKYLQNDYQVIFVYVCSGELAGDPKKREEESRESAKLLGVNTIFFLQYPQFTMFENRMKIKDDLEKLVLEYKPVTIFTPWGEDPQEDHKYISEQTLVAARGVHNIYFYPTPSSKHFFPDTIIYGDTSMLRIKEAALSSHESQITTKRLSIEYPKITSDYWKSFFGHHSRFPLNDMDKENTSAEVFRVYRQSLL